MTEEIPETKVFATFERLNEFLDLQQTLLSLEIQEEPGVEAADKELLTQQSISAMVYFQLDLKCSYPHFISQLTEYQEQSYLLDPYLEQLVEPVVQCLKSHAKQSIAHPESRASSTRVRHIALLMYSYIKCRGYKTIS